jgi:hypothetical protein
MLQGHTVPLPPRGSRTWRRSRLALCRVVVGAEFWTDLLTSGNYQNLSARTGEGPSSVMRRSPLVPSAGRGRL